MTKSFGDVLAAIVLVSFFIGLTLPTPSSAEPKQSGPGTAGGTCHVVDGSNKGKAGN